MREKILISTGGGDAPGLNAVIFAVVNSATRKGWEVYGSRSGYGGLLDKDDLVRLNPEDVEGILSQGGTILGSTNKGNPFAKPVENLAGEIQIVDISDKILNNFERMGFFCHIAVGGDGSLEIAHRFAQKGMPVIGVPKTIDNDLEATDRTFGFDTAVSTATDAIDKLHSTAKSHDRVMVVEVMGRESGWIALYSGISGGADVILIPEIPYDVNQVAEAIRRRRHRGKNFSIVAVSEGALSLKDAAELAELEEKKRQAKDDKKQKKAGAALTTFHAGQATSTLRLSHELESLTGLESRVTILGHLQRGGTPTAADRILATRLGTACAEAIHDKRYGCMVAVKGESTRLVPLAEVVGKRKHVPPDHPWVRAALETGACLGNRLP